MPTFYTCQLDTNELPFTLYCPSDQVAFLQDLIGAPVETDDFVVGGTCTEYLFGACESLYKPNMVSSHFFLASRWFVAQRR